MGYLDVSFDETLRRSAGHSTWIDTSGAVKLSKGWKGGSHVLVNGKDVGELWLSVADSLYGYNDLDFMISFNDTAAATDAQAILRAITYSYGGSSTSSQKIEAWIALGDSYGYEYGDGFGSETEAKVTIDVAGATPSPPPPPTTSYETTFDFTLPADALNVTADGKGNVKLTGNDLGNAIKGNVGKNTIDAGAGNDKVDGGLGNDVLTGGKGQDKFIFASKHGTSKTDRKVNFDTLKDFSAKDDSIYLENAIFKKLGKKGSEAKPAKLDKKFFSLDKAKDKDDYVIYSKKTGVLSYDADGSGKGQAVEFALLTKKPTLKFDDFFVI